MGKVPSYNVDFYSDDFITDPVPHYANMRALGPVVWLPQLSNYALTRHADVRAALRNHTVFISSKGVAGDQFGCDFLQGNTVASDEPRHSELRRAMAPPLLPGALGSLEEPIQKSADRLIETLLSRRQFDAIADLARHLPMTIVRDQVGLPDFGQENMLRWAAAAFDVLGVQNERGRAALGAIAEMRTFIERDATPNKLKIGSWTHRIHALVEAGQLPCEHAAFAIRDYINPSLDTTISATGELIYQLAHNPGQWEALKLDPSKINHAVNEAVRLGTPIRSFTRQTAITVDVGGTTLPAGARVMMLFASANRDEDVFPDPNAFRLDRNPADHLGFGSGIHMCVGMHLAQLEMAALLRAMIPRVRKITINHSTRAMNNTISAFASLATQFERETRTIVQPEREARNSGTKSIMARVGKRRDIAGNVVHLVLEPDGSRTLPNATAGSHIDVHLSPELVRQYSLTGPIRDGQYEIAVQREPTSRGGSDWIYNHVKAGDSLTISLPRNHFPLRPGTNSVLLIAGGIGITPLWAMAWECHRSGREFTLHVCVRTRSRLPFADELINAPFSDRVNVWIDDEGSQFDAATALAIDDERPEIYLCGPKGFMDAITASALESGFNTDQLHTEHFGAAIDVDGEPFTVFAAKSNKELTIPADQSILSALRAAGIDVTTSCENGVCGSCLLPVIEGNPDHRDLVQTESEKASNSKIAVCCSRSKSKRLVIDV